MPESCQLDGCEQREGEGKQERCDILPSAAIMMSAFTTSPEVRVTQGASSSSSEMTASNRIVIPRLTAAL
jgi:hypothetical protein